MRLKGLNAEKLKPIIKKDRDVNSILAESVEEPKEIVDEFDIRNMIITDSMSNNIHVLNHGEDSALRQLVTLCQRLKFSPTKISVLKGLIRRIETSENDLNKLMNQRIAQVGRRENSGNR